jgi:stearoyl-CoA desaturase (delta-9 desaturase)
MGSTNSETVKFYLHVYIGVVLLHVIGIYSVYTFLTGTSLSWLWSTLVGYIFIAMLGISACYHRLLSHKSFTTYRPVKIFLIWCASLAVQGSPIAWVTIHRGYHHRNADKAGDPHSPRDGFWHSFLGWQFKTKPGNMSPKYTMDLLKDPDCVFFHKYYVEILFLSHIVLACISFNLWLYAILLPCFITSLTFSINTSFNHYLQFGYRNYETADDSVNSVWLWFLILGEAWHNNHHGDAKNPTTGKKWWELDPTYWLIKLIRIN